MSSDGSITREWGDGEHTFRLRIKELRELEEKRNSGSMEICKRITDGSWKVDDLFEVLRLGLIGGGMQAPLALGLVSKYVTPGAISEHIVPAQLVLVAALFGDPFDLVGKALAETGAAASSEDAPDSRQSSALVPQWDGLSRTLTDALSGNSPPPLKDGNGVMAQTPKSDRPQ